MDKIRVASMAGMKKYLARRQMDKSISLLCHFDGNLKNEVDGAMGIETSPSTSGYVPAIVGHGYQMQNSTITWDTSLNFSGDFCISWWHSIEVGFYQCNFSVGGPVSYLRYNGANADMSFVGSGVDKVVVNVGHRLGWRHMACTRKEGVIRLFENGIVKASVTNNEDYSQSFTKLFSSVYRVSDSSVFDELRIVCGSSVWESNFTPPTTPFTGYEAL